VPVCGGGGEEGGERGCLGMDFVGFNYFQHI